MGRSTSSGSRGARARRELPPELERPLDVGRIVRVAVVAVLVVVAVVLLPALVPRSTPYGGPLQDASLSGPMAVGGRRATGERASFGFVLPWNTAEQEAVLEGVVPISPTAGIEVVGAGVLGPEEEVVPFGPDYPPQGKLKPPPVRGYRVPSGSSALDSYQLVIGVRATEPGVQSIAGFVVEYAVAGVTYRAIVLQGVWVCAPRGEQPSCRGRDELARRQDDLRGSLLPLIEAPDR